MTESAADTMDGEARRDAERRVLERIWAPPKGWRIISAVNNTVVGYFYIGAAFLFFLLAGVLGLLIRAQLAVPSNTFLSPDTYNQIFTMHGTVMMFLFAVPAVEAVGILLLPQMLGARDLPFPRLGAFAFWAYFIGGLVFFCTLFFDLAPSGGWFMYPPLTSIRYSPGIGADFWLLGIGFIEISATIKLLTTILTTSAAVVLKGSAGASAGPCTQQITELSKHLAASDAGMGPTGAKPAPTAGNQKGQHPPAAIMGQQTEGRALSPGDTQRQSGIRTQASSALALARKLDDQGRAECKDAVDLASELSRL